MLPKSWIANSVLYRNHVATDGTTMCASNERIWTGSPALTSTTPSGWTRDSASPATGKLVRVMLLILRLAAASVGWLAETGSRSEHAPRVKAQVRRKNRADFIGGFLYGIGQMPS